MPSKLVKFVAETEHEWKYGVFWRPRESNQDIRTKMSTIEGINNDHKEQLKQLCSLLISIEVAISRKKVNAKSLKTLRTLRDAIKTVVNSDLCEKYLSDNNRIWKSMLYRLLWVSMVTVDLCAPIPYAIAVGLAVAVSVQTFAATTLTGAAAIAAASAASALATVAMTLLVIPLVIAALVFLGCGAYWLYTKSQKSAEYSISLNAFTENTDNAEVMGELFTSVVWTGYKKNNHSQELEMETIQVPEAHTL